MLILTYDREPLKESKGLNFLKGYIGKYIGDNFKGTEGDTRSLDSAHDEREHEEIGRVRSG